MGFICLMMECLDVKYIKSRYIVAVSFCNKSMPCVEGGRLRFEMRCCTQVNLSVGLSSSPLVTLCSSPFKQDLWASLPGFPPWPAWRQCDRKPLAHLIGTLTTDVLFSVKSRHPPPAIFLWLEPALRVVSRVSVLVLRGLAHVCPDSLF